MKKDVNLNSVHLNYLTPLLKWRVMDLESLRKENMSALSYKNFHRIIRGLEKKEVLQGYRDPFSRKKFVYLSSFGEDQLSLKENPTAISQESLIHDTKVSEFCRTLLNLGWALEAELEHQIHDKRQFKMNFKVIPDALIYLERNGYKYQLAFELERHRKNNQKIIEKMRQYGDFNFYHYILYLFPSWNLMEKYRSLAIENLEPEKMGKFMFFTHSEMSQGFDELGSIQGYVRDKKVTLGEVLSQN